MRGQLDDVILRAQVALSLDRWEAHNGTIFTGKWHNSAGLCHHGQIRKLGYVYAWLSPCTGTFLFFVRANNVTCGRPVKTKN
jgi:hypothetical protein